jgi:hypothetical protein
MSDKVTLPRLAYIFIFCIAFLIQSCGGSNSEAVVREPTLPIQPNGTIAFSPNSISLSTGDFVEVSIVSSGDVGDELQIDISCDDNGRIEDNLFISHFVTELTNVTCQVRTTNGITATLNAEVRPIESTRKGDIVGVYQPYLDLKVGARNNSASGIDGEFGYVIGTRTSRDSALIEAVVIGPGLDGEPNYRRDDVRKVHAKFASLDYIFSPSLSATGLPSNDLSLLSEDDDVIVWSAQEHTGTSAGDYPNLVEISIKNPCMIAQTYTSLGADTVIGQVNEGLSFYRINTPDGDSAPRSFDAEFVSNAGQGRSLCSIFRTTIDGLINDEGIYFSETDLGTITALDHQNLEVVSYGDANNDNVYEELVVVPILDEGDNPLLKIVDVWQSDSGVRGPNYFIIALSDGNHFGDHRLMLVYLDGSLIPNRFDGSQTLILQTIHTWDTGVPIQISHGDFGGSRRGGIFSPDLLVLLKNSEYALFFDDKAKAVEDPIVLPPIYEGVPSKIPVGIGASSAVTAEMPQSLVDDERNTGYLVSYSDTGELRIFNINDYLE